jgi:hypothetical protein
MNDIFMKKNMIFTGKNTGLLLFTLLALVGATSYMVSQRATVTNQKSRATNRTSCSLVINITPPPSPTPIQSPTPVCVVPPTNTPTPTSVPTIPPTPMCVPPNTGTPTPSPIVTTRCTYTQGYWKTHPNVWPVPGLSLGSIYYTKAQLLSIFDKPVAGNGLISLSHQLIAAKLNIINNAVSDSAVQAISEADNLIGSLNIESGTLSTSAVNSLVARLDLFNKGELGIRHCSE